MKRVLKSLYRSLELIFAALIGGICSYWIGKYTDTGETSYFAVLLIIVFIIGVVVFIINLFKPSDLD